MVKSIKENILFIIDGMLGGLVALEVVIIINLIVKIALRVIG